MAIFYALAKGYKDIRLIGFNHDWLAYKVEYQHFYNSRHDTLKELSNLTYYDRIVSSLFLFKYYEELLKLSQLLGAKIVNYSSDTFLDIFPCVSNETT